MRCKIGDVVMVVKSPWSENIGKIGTVTGQAVAPSAGDWLCEFPSKLTGRLVEDPTKASTSKMVNFKDDHLQPIRDNDGEDEMLRLVGKPNEERASKEKANERAWLEQFN